MNLDSRLSKLSANGLPRYGLHNFRRLILESSEELSINSNPWLNVVTQYVLKIQSTLKKPEKSILRNLLTRFLPWDPLNNLSPNTVHLFVLTSPKDVEILPYSLLSSIQACSGQITEITVVLPESIHQRATDLLSEISETFHIQIKTDEEILAKNELTRSDFLNGHPLMIAMKYLCVLDSQSEDNLVTDGDTLFLRKKTWSSGKTIVLTAAQEYQPMHMNYCREIFGLKSNSGYGFTTQSQLFRKSNVSQIVEYLGSAKNLGLNFANYYANYTTGLRPDLFPADWQLHSDWTMEKSNLDFKISGYSNVGMSRNLLRFPLIANPTNKEIYSLLENIRTAVPNLGSLSLHDYK